MFKYSCNGSNDVFVMHITTIKKEIKSTRTQRKTITNPKMFALTWRTVRVEDFSYLNKVRSNAEVWNLFVNL